MKIIIDQQRCCAAGYCALTAPRVFAQRDEDGIVVVLQENPPAELHKEAREAASLCPANAIEIVDA